MKRLTLAVILALAAPLVYAQSAENYTIPASGGASGVVAQLTEIVNAVNLETCFRWGKLSGCTDTGASGTCVAAGAAGGSSCTAAQARTANARIFPQTEVGRGEYTIHRIATPEFEKQKEIPNRVSKIAVCQWFNAQNQTVKDAECAKYGLLANCPCPAQ
jgi:hypothetical protein